MNYDRQIRPLERENLRWKRAKSHEKHRRQTPCSRVVRKFLRIFLVLRDTSVLAFITRHTQCFITTYN